MSPYRVAAVVEIDIDPPIAITTDDDEFDDFAPVSVPNSDRADEGSPLSVSAVASLAARAMLATFVVAGVIALCR